MTGRRDRQVEELRDLCSRGAVARAVDLVFEHFAEFGHDDAIVAFVTDAIGTGGSSDRIRARLAELLTRPRD